MTVMVGGQQWGSDLVPVGIEEYGENLSFLLDDNTNGPRSWKLVEDWVSNCATHHKLCSLQAKSSSTFLPTSLFNITGEREHRNYSLVLRNECPPKHDM
jgi:hypothetical protein